MSNFDPDGLANPQAHARREAAPLFIDRESQLASFRVALEAQRQLLALPTMLGLARQNALVFYGVGGVGKSAISKRLEAWASGWVASDGPWGVPVARPPDAQARVDLHSSAGNFDIVAALIEIRTALSQVRRSWPAFDLAMAAYSGHHARVGWADQDWQRAAKRALAHVRTRHDASARDLDQTGTLEAVVLGIHLIASTGVLDAWVDAPLMAAPSFAGIAARIPHKAETDIGQHYVDFIIAKARLQGGRQSRKSLARLAGSDGPLNVVARRHHAYRLREIGRSDAAIAEFEKLAVAGDADMNAYHRAFTMVQARRFADASVAARSLSADRAGLISTACSRFHGSLQVWSMRRFAWRSITRPTVASGNCVRRGRCGCVTTRGLTKSCSKTSFERSSSARKRAMTPH